MGYPRCDRCKVCRGGWVIQGALDVRFGGVDGISKVRQMQGLEGWMGYPRCDRCKVWRGGWDILGTIYVRWVNTEYDILDAIYVWWVNRIFKV